MSVAGLLGPAEGQVGLGADGGSVDVENTRFHFPHGLERFVDILGVYRRGKAVHHSIADVDGLIQAVAGDDGNYRPENFLLRDAHLGVAVAEDGGSVKSAAVVSVAGESVSAAQQLRALVLADLDVLLDR